MLGAALFGLGWLVSGYVVARLIARAMRAGARREDALPTRPADRAAWIRGEEPPGSPPITPSHPDIQQCSGMVERHRPLGGLRAAWRD